MPMTEEGLPEESLAGRWDGRGDGGLVCASKWKGFSALGRQSATIRGHSRIVPSVGNLLRPCNYCWHTYPSLPLVVPKSSDSCSTRTPRPVLPASQTITVPLLALVVLLLIPLLGPTFSAVLDSRRQGDVERVWNVFQAQSSRASRQEPSNGGDPRDSRQHGTGVQGIQGI